MKKVNLKANQKQEAPSKFSKLRRLEAQLQSINSLLSNKNNKLEILLQNHDKMKMPDLLAKLEKDKAAIEKDIVEERVTLTKLMDPTPHSRISRDFNESAQLKANIRDIFWAGGGTGGSDDTVTSILGISQTRFLVPERIIEWPDDDDTDWEYEAQFYDLPGIDGFYSLAFKHWMRDQTHSYSYDTADFMWMVSHFGFEFPAPAFDGTLHFVANTSFQLSARIDTEETGFLRIELLLEEQTIASSPPSTYEDYSRFLCAEVFDSTEYNRVTPYLILGSFPVKKDQKSRIWFGLNTMVAAEGGIAGTTGWGYFKVKAADIGLESGIQYLIQPD